MCSLLRAKGSAWIPPDGHILVLVPRFDREFVMTFQGRGRNGARFVIKFLFNEGLCLNKLTFPRNNCSERTAHHPSWHMVRQVSVCLSFKPNFSEVFEVLSSNDGSNII